MIIGITGSARSGKDTAAKFLSETYNYDIKSFAAPIRLFVSNLIGINDPNIFDSIKDKPNILLSNKTPRYAMQTLGTEWGRKMISDTIWIDTCLSNCKNTIISDVRFDNEAKAILEKGGIIIRIVRPNINISENTHISEKGISENYIVHTIENNADLSTFKTKVKEYFCKLQVDL